MCLYVDFNRTEKELKNPESRIFYKTFIKKKNSLVSAIFNMTITKPGYITIEKPIIYNKQREINGGAFHAYTDPDNRLAWYWIVHFDLGEPICVPISILSHEDLIAYGITGDVAVKGYTITPEIWAGIFV